MQLSSLSIHDLTRRSTAEGYTAEKSGFLSIHDLTRRSTQIIKKMDVEELLSIHDLTRRSTVSGPQAWFPLQSFNSRPHKEVDASIASGGSPR